MLNPRLYAASGWVLRKGMKFVYGTGLGGSILDPMRSWSRKRAPLPLPAQSFRELWKKGLSGNGGKKG